MEFPAQMPWAELAPDERQAALLGVLALGLLYAFLGHRLLRLMIGLTGFLLAAASAAVLAGWLSRGHPWVMLGVAVAGGLCGAMALFFLYRVGVFAVGGFAAAILLHGVLSGRPEAWAPWAVLAGGIAGGLLALLLERPVMVLATAVIGGWAVAFSGAALLLGDALSERLADGSDDWLPWALLGTWVACALLGAAFQCATHRRRGREPGEVR